MSESRYGSGGDGHNRKVRLREIHRVRIEDAGGQSLGVRSGDGTYVGEENSVQSPKLTGRMEGTVNNFMIDRIWRVVIATALSTTCSVDENVNAFAF
ncbi:hypothetical protein A2U01_0052556 [Trifolium medium]|uniref:Uncharacterized protein n=1 Tax=Trifolium medium TaxID=97028 RepID=A0A392R5G5_9FABA|nr:hypothetical protein [Trifolium medium]